MTFEIGEDTVGLWFAPVGSNADVMMGMRREGEGASERFVIIWRMRYYDEADPTNRSLLNSPDRKSRHSSASRPGLSRDAAIRAAFQSIALVAGAAGGGIVEEFLMDERGVPGLVERLHASRYLRSAQISQAPGESVEAAIERKGLVASAWRRARCFA